MIQIHERVMDGLKDILSGMDPTQVKTGIKTCVRFYDYDGLITESVLGEQRIEAERIMASGQLEEEGLGVVRRYLLYRRLKRLSGEILSAPKKRHALAINTVTKLIRAKQAIAIETHDHHFRPISDDEAHELIEAITVSKHSWIFCFKHNDLLADQNVGVAHAF